jgi:hypothetical protein
LLDEASDACFGLILDDSATDNAEDCDAGDHYWFTSGSDAPIVTSMGAASNPTVRNFIALGDDIRDFEMEIGKTLAI